jgi:hypothetical protein
MIPPDFLFLLYMAWREETRTFRADVPVIPPPPDRDQWLRDHGVMAYRLTPVGFLNRVRYENFARKARACIERDLTTIDRKKAIGEQVTLEHICERVKVALDIPNGDHVFFDPGDNRFWVYPANPSRDGVR